MSTNAGGVRSMLTRMQIQGFLVSGARLYYRGPEVYLYGYKYSTLGGGFTATLSFSATCTYLRNSPFLYCVVLSPEFTP